MAGPTPLVQVSSVIHYNAVLIHFIYINRTHIIPRFY